jgi:hypothetical protein
MDCVAYNARGGELQTRRTGCEDLEQISSESAPGYRNLASYGASHRAKGNHLIISKPDPNLPWSTSMFAQYFADTDPLIVIDHRERTGKPCGSD